MSLFAIKNDEGKYLHIPEAFCDHDWDTRADAWDDREVAKDVTHHHGGHVVELVEKPALIVVSEEEAKMLKKAKNTAVWRPASVIAGYAYDNTKDPDDEELLEDRLMRAYVIGWTVEKQKRWNVKVPHATNSYYYDMGWGNGLETKDMKAGTQPLSGFREAQFTQDEINKRGLQYCECVEVTDDEQ